MYDVVEVLELYLNASKEVRASVVEILKQEQRPIDLQESHLETNL